jgi:hypothetical protein
MDISTDDDETSRIFVACEWLKMYLLENQPAPSSQVKSLAKAYGDISDRMIIRAAKRLGVVIKAHARPDEPYMTTWSLPEGNGGSNQVVTTRSAELDNVASEKAVLAPRKNHGIPTLFRGIEYRSRLEARWAALFDQIGWNSTYEPFDGNGYIPDFVVHDDPPLLVEVKPAVTKADYEEPWSKINDGLKDDWNGGVFIAGVDPLPKLLQDNKFGNAAGLIARSAALEICKDCPVLGLCKDSCKPRWWKPSHDAALWIMASGKISLFAVTAIVPGGYDGQSFGGNVDESNLTTKGAVNRVKEAWANACNEVKWRGRQI